MTDWLDGWEVIEATASGGSLVDGDNRKGLLHSTEGSSVEGAVGAYTNNGGWPNATVDPTMRRRVQHYPLGTTARGLEHPAGTPETNRAVIFQIEIVGFAADLGNLPADAIAWLGTEVIRPVSIACGIPMLVGIDTSVGAPRMTTDEFAAYAGWMTHGVAPSQPGGHWDPGYLDVPAVIAAATPPPDPGDDMPLNDADLAAIAKVVQAEVAKLVNDPGYLPKLLDEQAAKVLYKDPDWVAALNKAHPGLKG